MTPNAFFVEMLSDYNESEQGTNLKHEVIAMLNFKDCTLLKLEKMFAVQQVGALPALDDWLSMSAEISDDERKMVAFFRVHLVERGYDWNETELAYNFIGPLMGLADFITTRFNFFAERAFGGVVEGVEMTGRPDGMIASGIREPEEPYFCFQEYKKHKDPEGDPAGQALAAMLVAQAINTGRHPVYGAYVIGYDWFFMALQEKRYAISAGYMATRDDVFDIFRILKALKQIISGFVGEDAGMDAR